PSPVKLILFTPGCATRAAPTSGPPGTTLTTPGGKPAASISLASSSVVTGVCSAGLSTTVQPAASAGASFHTAAISGTFQGVIAPTTPTGRRVVKACTPASTGMVRPDRVSASAA